MFGKGMGNMTGMMKKVQKMQADMKKMQEELKTRTVEASVGGGAVTVVMNEHVDYDGKQYPIASLPENLMSIIQAGGLVKAMRKLNGLD